MGARLPPVLCDVNFQHWNIFVAFSQGYLPQYNVNYETVKKRKKIKGLCEENKKSFPITVENRWESMRERDSDIWSSHDNFSKGSSTGLNTRFC
jgi:hypothetical protein